MLHIHPVQALHAQCVLARGEHLGLSVRVEAYGALQYALQIQCVLRHLRAGHVRHFMYAI